MSWVESGNGLIIPGGVGALGLPPGQRQLTNVSNGWTWDDPRKYPVGRPYGSEMRYSSWAEMEEDGWMRSGLTDNEFRFLGDAVEVTFPAQTARIYKAAPAGDFEVIAHMTGPQGGNVSHYSMTGIVIANTSGTGVGGTLYNGGWFAMRVTAWAYAATAINVGETVTSYLEGSHYWASLRKIGADTYWRVSGNQSTWNAQAEESWTPTAFTPAYFGICRMYTGGSANAKAVIHRIRVVSGTWVP